MFSALAFALAGCESSSSLLANGADSAPQAQLTAPTAQPATTQTARMEIAPIIGAPDGVAKDLQTQLGSAIERNKLTVARGPSAKGEYVLRGYVVAAREKSGTKVSYIWDVTDQAGKRAHRITGEETATASSGADPWSSVNPQVIQSIADKTAQQIATWNNSLAGVPVASATQAAGAQQVAAAATPAAASAAATPAPTQAVATSPAPAAQTAALTPGAASGTTTGSIVAYDTVVPGVVGAPGDGSVALTSAIQRELSKGGVPLTTTAGGASTYKVEGVVAMGQGKDGKQPIQIDWTVFDPKGKKLGTVTQKNEVPQGSLDGTWGKTADAAAQAAAQGIVKLLPQTKTN